MRVGPVWGKPWGRIGLGLALGLIAPFAPTAPVRSAPPPQQAAPPATEKYHRFRAFRIPFDIKPADRVRYQEVLLYVSSNRGHDWEANATTQSDQPYFPFRAPRDGEYWFAVRSRDNKGRLYPPDDATIEPSLRVIIDTLPPVVSLYPEARPAGGRASVRWEIVEENFDPRSVLIEYQTLGAKDWSKVPITPARIGKKEWSAGTAEALRVRLTATDLAGNTKSTTIELPEGTATRPELADIDPRDEMAPPPIPTLTGRETPLVDSTNMNAEPEPRSQTPAPVAGTGGGFDPFTASAPTESASSAGGPSPPLLVASPQFALHYEVDDAGPSGRPAVVELWITQNGGQTWFRRGVDPDQTSPFPVDLGGEGSFGLKLVARSASNQGDAPPSPGEPPQTLVEVDSSPPVVKLDPVKVVTQGNAAKVEIVWHASDPHLGSRPVRISVRPEAAEAPWQPITPVMANSGRFTWAIPANFPSRFHVRVDVIDTLGNRGYAETTETGPVLVDRTRPRGRIIGLDPAHRTGSGPSARPMR